MKQQWWNQQWWNQQWWNQQWWNQQWWNQQWWNHQWWNQQWWTVEPTSCGTRTSLLQGLPAREYKEGVPKSTRWEFPKVDQSLIYPLFLTAIKYLFIKGLKQNKGKNKWHLFYPIVFLLDVHI